MAARYGQKIKLFRIVDILKKYTDEEHPMSAEKICDRLASMGVSAERKAIYDDIRQLTDYGFDIIKTRIPKSGFFLASREFELPEIYLLADAVRTAKFITPKKTSELISKLESMLSVYQSKTRLNGVFVDNVGKCNNEEIFYSIDAISRAIENGHRIKYKYGTRSMEKGREISLKQKERIISPYALTWQDDHYYLIGNYDKYDDLIHLRVDRMRSVTETDIQSRPFSEVSEYKDTFDVADYTKKLFSMHGGQMEDMKLRCSKEIIEQVIDRFSDKVFFSNVTDSTFEFSTQAVISDALVTWIMNYGDNIEVLNPIRLRSMIKERAEKILKVYK